MTLNKPVTLQFQTNSFLHNYEKASAKQSQDYPDQHTQW